MDACVKTVNIVHVTTINIIRITIIGRFIVLELFSSNGRYIFLRQQNNKIILITHFLNVKKHCCFWDSLWMYFFVRKIYVSNKFCFPIVFYKLKHFTSVKNV